MVIVKGIDSLEGINRLITRMKEAGIETRILRGEVTSNTIEYIPTKNISKLQIKSALLNVKVWDKLKMKLKDIEKVEHLDKAKETILYGNLSGTSRGVNLGVILHAEKDFKDYTGIDPGVLLQTIIVIFMQITIIVNAN